jgi:hypothetical protein
VYEVRSFLGLANYFRKYIKGYAAIASTLTDLLKGLDSKNEKVVLGVGLNCLLQNKTAYARRSKLVG